MSRKQTSLSVASIIIVLTASLAAVTLREFGFLGTAQGQASQELTPEQKSAICASVGSHVNTTESRICGIPKSPSSNATSPEITTPGAEAPPTDSAPSPSPPEE